MRTLTVILAAGDFPTLRSEARRLLVSATRVVACDSAAEEFFSVCRRWPDVVVGDLDSLTKKPTCEIVRVSEQETNDLQKAISLCRARGWNDLVILGATGGREDHTLGNLFRALENEVRVVTDAGEFLPVKGHLAFKAWKGAGVSIFASDPRTKMTSRGLEWKLDGVSFSSVCTGTLNRATSETVTVTSDRPAFAYLPRNAAAKRVAVSLGSNLGARAGFLRRACAALAKLPRTRLLDASSVLETEPVDVPRRYAELKFLNQAVLLETELSPQEFSRAMHAIEDRLGRVRTVRNGPRTIDIDLIDYEGVRLTTRELTIPHPRAAIRDFVLNPLKEIGYEL